MINSLPEIQFEPNVLPNIGKGEFERMFGLVLEGACPTDGGRLERRPGWGYAFCLECGGGWAAGTGDWRWIHHCPVGTPRSHFSYDKRGNVDRWGR